MATIFNGHWYTPQEAAAALDIDSDVVAKWFKYAAQGRYGVIPVAYYQGGDTPMITGENLVKLTRLNNAEFERALQQQALERIQQAHDGQTSGEG